MTDTPHTKPREVTGRTVLFWLVGFFALVIGVNAVMVKAATSTFGGVQTSSSYKAGLKFKQEIAAAEQQTALNWRVDGKLVHDKAGEAVLDIAVRDAKGEPVTGLVAVAHLEHPADARRDHDVPLSLIGAGQFHGVATAPAGQWELIIDLDRDGERVFRSRSRVTLK
ncbi:FixH family protein [Undibacter mobilis]|uniref:Nitrogen fixation protein FixH n=1 Tax=Undibacter mobilis TaxID=2292256 RepID=A0A371B9S3_9BRAD|nr:FixH family protein [Undibacter mobilis]RDV04365.1 nitrogen fixation protein FixH [Undibacter mobilis]